MPHNKQAGINEFLKPRQNNNAEMFREIFGASKSAIQHLIKHEYNINNMLANEEHYESPKELGLNLSQIKDKLETNLG